MSEISTIPVTACCMSSNEGTMRALLSAVYVLHLLRVKVPFAFVEIGLDDFVKATSCRNIIRDLEIL